MRSAPARADLVVTGGTIFTMDEARPRAQALAIADGVVVAVGDASVVSAWRGPHTRVLDLQGGVGTPGLTDAHAHLVGLGISLAEVDLRGARSVEEVVARLRDKAPSSGWITGRGWDQNLWPGAAMPTHGPLTQAFPDRPVWLRRVDGHAGWGNRALLQAAGIDRSTKAPAGGEILRDRWGEPTGVLIDAAMGLVPAPQPDRDALEAFIHAASRHVLARGLTGVHEMGIGPEADAVYRELAASGDPARRLPVRVHAYASEAWFVEALSGQAPDPIREDARYVLAGVKVYADGALGSRGAFLLEDYSDRPGHRGLMQHEPDAMRRLVESAVEGGWQVATHAIGDAANRMVLDTYAAALPRAASSDPRLRIEHCQIVHPDDVRRFAELGIVASVQPTHATSDMPWVPDRLGTARLPRAYPWKSFVEAGVHLCFGSDFPVELAAPTHGLYAAITRQDADGNPPGGWTPDERVDLDRALRGFTAQAAYAAHREDHLGRLVAGARADVTCFATAIDALAPRELRDAKILATIVDGEVAYEG